jgi:CRISPR/Cas system-associated exonuclease Cas4 (RecB family)
MISGAGAIALSVSGAVFVLVAAQFFRGITRHSKDKAETFYKKNYGEGDLVFAGETGRLLACRVGDVYLTGKPDLVLRDKNSGRAVIIDLKSGRAPAEMKPWHSLQLAAYFMLVESNLGMKADRGIIRYLDDGNKELTVDNTEGLAVKLKNRISDIAAHKADASSVPARNHCDPKRCLRCEFKTECRSAL